MGGPTRLHKVRPRIGPIDFNATVQVVVSQLRDGDPVTVRVVLRGREALRPEEGVRLLERFATAIGDAGRVRSIGPSEDRHVDMVLLPNPEPPFGE
jgi:translation initiation factor IF-3